MLLSSSAKSTRFPLRRLDLSVSSLLKSSKISFTSRSSRRAKKKQNKLSIFDLFRKIKFNYFQYLIFVVE